MTEGFDPDRVPIAPVARGRRDPELALDMDQRLGDVEMADEPGELGLAVGDQVLYKVTVLDADPVTGKDRWFQYGNTTSVAPNEVEEQTFTRVVSLVHNRLDEAIEHKDSLAQEKYEASMHQQIRPRR